MSLVPRGRSQQSLFERTNICVNANQIVGRLLAINRFSRFRLCKSGPVLFVFSRAKLDAYRYRVAPKKPTQQIIYLPPSTDKALRQESVKTFVT